MLFKVFTCLVFTVPYFAKGCPAGFSAPDAASVTITPPKATLKDGSLQDSTCNKNDASDFTAGKNDVTCTASKSGKDAKCTFEVGVGAGK